MDFLSFLVSATLIQAGCGDDECSSGERRLGSRCIAPAGQAADDAGSIGVSENADVRDGDAGTSVINPDRGSTSYDCRVDGHCAEWRMPDSLGKHPPSYRLEPDVVVDQITGLVWQRHVTSRSCSPSPGHCSTQQTTDYCNELSLGGITDWRLPSVIELQSLFVLESPTTLLDSTAFPDADANALLATKPVEQQGRRSVIAISSGTTLEGPSPSAEAGTQARCVSSGHRGMGARYTIDAARGIVADNWTTLTWRLHEEDGLFDFDGAKRQCASLGEGWRLPTMKELFTLVTPSHTQRCIDERVFPPPTSEELWSSVSLDHPGRTPAEHRTVQLGLDMRVIEHYRCGNLMPHDAVQRARFNVRCVR